MVSDLLEVFKQDLMLDVSNNFFISLANGVLRAGQGFQYLSALVKGHCGLAFSFIILHQEP